MCVRWISPAAAKAGYALDFSIQFLQIFSSVPLIRAVATARFMLQIDLVLRIPAMSFLENMHALQSILRFSGNPRIGFVAIWCMNHRVSNCMEYQKAHKGARLEKENLVCPKAVSYRVR